MYLLLTFMQMLAYCQARRVANTKSRSVQASHPKSTSAAAHAQARGLAFLANLSTARRSVSLPSVASMSSRTSHSASAMPSTPANLLSPLPLTPILQHVANLPSPTPPSKADKAAQEAEKAAQEVEELAHDMRTVRNELHRYKDDGVLPEDTPLDLVGHWDVSTAILLNSL